MMHLLHKIINFFDYFFYRATKTMVFDKDLDDRLFGGRCLLCIFLYFLVGIVLWPVLGLFTDSVTKIHLGCIIIALEIALLLFSGKRYSDERLFKKLDEKYNNESHSVLYGLFLLLFVAVVVFINLLLLKHCVNVL